MTASTAFLTIPALGALYPAGRLTPRMVTEACVDRIAGWTGFVA